MQHNEELHNLYASPDIRVIESTMLRWVGHVACRGEVRSVYKIFVGKPEGKRPLGRLGVDGRITLRWTLGR